MQRKGGPTPATHMMPPSPSSKLAIWTVGDQAASDGHREKIQLGVGSFQDVGLDGESSKPTHTTVSPPDVLFHDNGTLAVAESTKKTGRASLDSLPPTSKW